MGDLFRITGFDKVTPPPPSPPLLIRVAVQRYFAIIFLYCGDSFSQLLPGRNKRVLILTEKSFMCHWHLAPTTDQFCLLVSHIYPTILYHSWEGTGAMTKSLTCVCKRLYNLFLRRDYNTSNCSDVCLAGIIIGRCRWHEPSKWAGLA